MKLPHPIPALLLAVLGVTCLAAADQASEPKPKGVESTTATGAAIRGKPGAADEPGISRGEEGTTTPAPAPSAPGMRPNSGNGSNRAGTGIDPDSATPGVTVGASGVKGDEAGKTATGN